MEDLAEVRAAAPFLDQEESDVAFAEADLLVERKLDSRAEPGAPVADLEEVLREGHPLEVVPLVPCLEVLACAAALAEENPVASVVGSSLGGDLVEGLDSVDLLGDLVLVCGLELAVALGIANDKNS